MEYWELGMVRDTIEKVDSLRKHVISPIHTRHLIYGRVKTEAEIEEEKELIRQKLEIEEKKLQEYNERLNRLYRKRGLYVVVFTYSDFQNPIIWRDDRQAEIRWLIHKAQDEMEAHRKPYQKHNIPINDSYIQERIKLIRELEKEDKDYNFHWKDKFLRLKIDPKLMVRVVSGHTIYRNEAIYYVANCNICSKCNGTAIIMNDFNIEIECPDCMYGKIIC